MSYQIHANDEEWASLIANEDDYILIGAFRIIPGEWDKQMSRKYQRPCRSYTFRSVEEEYEHSRLTSWEAYDACGQEVVGVFYVQKEGKRNIFLLKSSSSTTLLLAAINVHNGHVTPASVHPQWKGDKKDTLAARKATLTKLIVKLVGERMEFERFFLPSGGAPSNHGPQ